MEAYCDDLTFARRSELKIATVRLFTMACSGLNGSDVTVQDTNWFADGCAPRIVRYALSAQWTLTDNLTDREYCQHTQQVPKASPDTINSKDTAT